MSIREPAADRHRVLWVEDVRCRGVVDDDGILQISTDLRKILYLIRHDRDQESSSSTYLDVISLMVVTALSEKPMMYNAMDI